MSLLAKKTERYVHLEIDDAITEWLKRPSIGGRDGDSTTGYEIAMALLNVVQRLVCGQHMADVGEGNLTADHILVPHETEVIIKQMISKLSNALVHVGKIKFRIANAGKGGTTKICVLIRAFNPARIKGFVAANPQWAGLETLKGVIKVKLVMLANGNVEEDSVDVFDLDAYFRGKK